MANDDDKQRLERIKSSIRAYEDFPKKGILFRDVFPLFQRPSLLEDTFYLMQKQIEAMSPRVGAIVGLDSRGFLFGPSLALRLDAAFVPVRKKGKLPGKVKSAEYQLEYGSDVLEIQESSISPGLECVIVDDLLATGGSIKTAINLIEQCGGKVLGSVVVVELTYLKGREKISSPVSSLLQYSD